MSNPTSEAGTLSQPQSPPQVPPLPDDIPGVVRLALNEDVGIGDLTAELIPPDRREQAVLISREEAVLCGTAWFDEVFRQLDATIIINWRYTDGERIPRDVTLCTLSGRARTLLTGERTALNFLQLLSGIATRTRCYADLLTGTRCQLLDTRKTLPGLRRAQKYAVACGGGKNHRMGLYDAILIKENHIHAAGGIASAVAKGKSNRQRVEIEVENLAELEQAITAGADIIMLDNFDIDRIQEAVRLNRGRARLEVSGNVTPATLPQIAATGVDYVSVGDLTKNVRAIDFSMRIM
jgi:nicotinate-nucleotide pyrophosphorylase (carboxylating)